jgi:hypothetical protein
VRLRDVAAFLAPRERAALFRLRVAAAFFAAATRFGDFLVVLRAVDLRDVAAFLAARERVALLRLRVAAAFFAAATRFGDFLVVLRAVVFRAVVLRAVVFLPVRFLVAAAFFAAATRFGDFLVDFRAVDFFAADFRAVVFRAVVLRAVVFRAPAFFATERFLAATDFSADATCRRVSSCFCITAGSDIGPPIGVSAVEPSPCGRHGSGLGKSIPSSRSGWVSVEAGSSSWFSQGQPRSWVIPPPPRSGSTRSYPYTSRTKHRSSPATLTWR